MVATARRVRPTKRRLHTLLDGTDTSDRFSFTTNLFIMGLIVANVSTYVAGTAAWVDAR